MKTFIVKLAFAAVPLISLVAVIVLVESLSRKRVIVQHRAKRTQAAVRHAFAVAATQKWF